MGCGMPCALRLRIPVPFGHRSRHVFHVSITCAAMVPMSVSSSVSRPLQSPDFSSQFVRYGFKFNENLRFSFSADIRDERVVRGHGVNVNKRPMR